VSSNQILDQSNPPQACLWLFGFSPGADTSLPLVRKPPASGNNATALHSWGDAVAKKGFASTPHWVSLCDLRAFAVNSDLRWILIPNEPHEVTDAQLSPTVGTRPKLTCRLRLPA